jgi:hypothetical protein
LTGYEVDAHVDGLPPNGLPFSCRERAVYHLQKANDLAREAVGCNGGLGGESRFRLTSVDLLHGKRYVLQLFDQAKSGARR